MKKALLPRLARTGIAKNRRLYVPYILSCVGMVTMFYILQALSVSPLLKNMRGGSTLEAFLTLGKYVIAVFAVGFLFYTNSFLLGRRFREFGLYSILGMDKRSISRIVLWESLYVALIGLAGGIGLGVLLSKLAELGLMNIIDAPIDFGFTVDFGAILTTAEVFAVIFVLLAIRSLIGIRRCKPLELLKSENMGEKPPKANRVLALLGVVILGAAYYIAITIKTPLQALLLFFVAVIMVIIATYLLFMTGSVALCRILQKNKKFYYKKQHFVSVSSMTYRMKRNGEGLASICILATMVLVMISSTTSLYFGIDDSIKSTYPRESEMSALVGSFDDLNSANIEKMRKANEDYLAESGCTPRNVTEFSYLSVIGFVDDNAFTPGVNVREEELFTRDDARELFFVDAQDYNRIMGTDYAPGPGEALVYPLHCTFKSKEITVGEANLTVLGTLNDFISIGEANSSLLPSLMFVVSDLSEAASLEKYTTDYGSALDCRYSYNIDFPEGTTEEEAAEIHKGRVNAFIDALPYSEQGFGYSEGCALTERAEFFSTYGGLFFLGIVLSIVFIFAAAVIIYYKQISEGYEDRARFSIMRKVGMTKSDIKKSINSQVLIVFFAPLLAAGLHLCFAFPMIWRLLTYFNLTNIGVAIRTNIIAFVVFGLFYILLYKATARAYYSIVSTDEK